MYQVTIIFPHQLFKDHPGLKKDRPILLIEDQLFFGDQHYPARFHKKKLVFHRASMKSYEHYLKEKGYHVTYINYQMSSHDQLPYIKYMSDKNISEIYVADVCDDILVRRLKKAAEKHNFTLHWIKSPGFFLSQEDIAVDFKKNKKLLMHNFYVKQRKSLNILLDQAGKPLGDKWSYDPENRKKAPADLKIPPLPSITPLSYVTDAIKYVETYFPHNPGNILPFFYPIDHAQAKSWLKDFLVHRLCNFGEYQDAILCENAFVFHSVLSPLLNSGLLTPDQVVEGVLDHADTHNVPLNSLEGFIRQVIGWREYVRGVYTAIGVEERNSNYWKHNHNLPKAFYEGNTGIVPVDIVLSRVIKNAYAHHIERLMILGNFMLLCEIDPQHVYRWFMEMFIDAYDWVMVPNVYGMSQYADGGLITTKPYFSGSNYILKMSDIKKGEWCEVWDALFWRFMWKHKNYMKKNPRLNMLIGHLENLGPKAIKEYDHVANKLFKQLGIESSS